MKANVKKLISMICVGTMGAALLGGCGFSAEENSVSSVSAEEEAEKIDSEDITTISVALCSVGDKTGQDEVIERVNEISREEIGVEIEVEWIEVGSWVEQMNLKMSSAESNDIIMVMPMMPLQTLLGQNALLDITDYLDEYGQDLLSVVPEEYMESMTKNGSVYGIPMTMSKQDGAYVAMRTDVLEELGLVEQAEAMDSWTDLEEILEVVKNNTDYVPLYCAPKLNVGVAIPDYLDLSADEWSEAYGLDNLGDSYCLIYADEETDEVCSYYESDIFKADIERAADFYSKGYLYTDGATTDTPLYTALSNGMSFAVVTATGELGAESTYEVGTGLDMTMVKICSETITSNLLSMWGYAIPYTAAEPEAAVEFLNLLYTNEEMTNLFVWGIEDRDYTLNDDGTVTTLDDATYSSQPWFHGNYSIMYPAESNGADYVAEMEEVIDNQTYSKYVGFMCDTSEITNELTACNTKVQEYAYSLLAGSVSDYDSMYETFMEELKSAGIDKVVECYQTQLDEWLAEQ